MKPLKFLLLSLAGLAASVTGNAAGVVLKKLEMRGGADLQPDATGLDALAVRFSRKYGGGDIDAMSGHPHGATDQRQGARREDLAGRHDLPPLAVPVIWQEVRL
jgi:hypothetical protein